MKLLHFIVLAVVATTVFSVAIQRGNHFPNGINLSSDVGEVFDCNITTSGTLTSIGHVLHYCNSTTWNAVEVIGKSAVEDIVASLFTVEDMRNRVLCNNKGEAKDDNTCDCFHDDENGFYAPPYCTKCQHPYTKDPTTGLCTVKPHELYTPTPSVTPRPTDMGCATVGETLVNVYTTSYQSSPRMAVAPISGKVVVVWHSENVDGSDDGVVARVFNADGTPATSDIVVSTGYTTGDQNVADVAVLNDDEQFVVVWRSSEGTKGWEVRTRPFYMDGTPVRTSMRVNQATTSTQYNPRVSRLSDGGYVIVWGTGWSSVDGSSYAVMQRRVTSGHSFVNSETRVNQYTTSTQRNPAVALLSSGDYVIAFQSNGQDGNSYSVVQRVYAPNGNARGSEMIVNQHTTGGQYVYDVAELADGHWVVSWYSAGTDTDGSNGVFGRIYDELRQPVGDEFRISTTVELNQHHVYVDRIASGGFAAVWTSQQDGSGHGIYSQWFNDAGERVGGEFRVNVETNSEQDGPAVAGLINGGVAYAWRSQVADNSDSGIVMRMMCAPGSPSPTPSSSYTPTSTSSYTPSWSPSAVPCVGSSVESLVNVYTTSYQSSPRMAVAPVSGKVVVVWHSENVDGSEDGVVARVFNADGTPATSDIVVSTGYTTGDQNVADVAVLNDDDQFVVVWRSAEDTKGWEVRTRPFYMDGTPVRTSMRVNQATTSTQYNPRVSRLSDGGYVIVWGTGWSSVDGSSYAVMQRRVTSGHSFVNSETRVNQYTTSTQRNPAVALLSSGDYVIAFQSNGQDGNSYSVVQRVYAPNGNARGSEMIVNQHTTGGQYVYDVAELADGHWVVSWYSAGTDTDGSNGVFGRIYDELRQPVGDEFRISTTVELNQHHVYVDRIASGGFAAVWTSQQDGSGHGIYSQWFNDAGERVGGEFRVNVETNSEQDGPAVAGLINGGVAYAWRSQVADNSDSGILMRILCAPVEE